MFGKKLLIFAFYFILLSAGVKAQLLDDTTRQIYSSKTTYYVQEEDILNLRERNISIDTNINDLHNIPFIFGRNTFFQNLGVFGTPVNDYGYQMQQQPGRRLGFDVFDIYAFQPEKVRYYDTRSPFSEVKYIQGSRGMQMADVTFSRNINYHWNFGFDYRIISTKKIIDFNRRAPQGISNAFDFYTRYFSPGEKKRYQILANFTYFDILFQETGGINPYLTNLEAEDFEAIRQRAFLGNARSSEKRFNYHIYQQFSILNKDKLQVYDIFDYKRTFNWFKLESNNSTPALDYLGFLGLTDTAGLPAARYYDLSTFNQTVYRLTENQAGLKGRLNSFTYRVYHRFRKYVYYHSYGQEAQREFTENFAGLALGYVLPDSSTFLVQAEKMDGPDEMIRAEYKRRHFSAGFNRIVHSPSLFHSYYAGNFYQWISDDLTPAPADTTDLLPVETNRYYIGTGVSGKRAFAGITGNVYSINNYIFLNSQGRRDQLLPGQKLTVISADVKAGVNLAKFHLENYTRLYKVEDKNDADTAFNVPEILNRTRFYYQNMVLRGTAYFQIGFDVNYRSGYFADKYSPFTRHFYLNNNLQLDPYLFLDLFINVKISNVTGFVKVENAAQGLLFFDNAYFETPGYLGMPRTLFFGIFWKFYN